MQNWKLYIVLFVSLFFLAFPVRLLQSCGPQESGPYNYTFINPKIANTQTTYAPFLLRFNDFYKNTDKKEDPQIIGNIDEWNERFCGLVKKEDMAQLIYKMNVQQVKSLRSATKSKSAKLAPYLNKNTFAYHLKEEKCLETIDYLIFAKKCEPHVIGTKGWKTPKRDTITMQKLIVEGTKRFDRIDSHYIKLRYAYQLVRLAHYAKKYQQVLDLHEYLMPKVDAHASIIYYWIMGHRAGALRKLGKRVEAAYMYALIFKNCPSKRTSAYRSFHIKTDEEWEQCMLLCKSDDERAVMYTLRASVEESRAVEEMEAIYDLDYANDNLDLLLVKEMKKLEKDLLGLEFNKKQYTNKKRYGIPRKKAGKYAIRLEKFVHKVIKEDSIPNIELWKIADGYIEFLRGDFYAAERTFDRIKTEVKSPLLQEQLNVFQLALKVNQYEDLDNESEMEIADLLRGDLFKKYKDFDNFLFDRLAMLYKQSDSPGRAFRSQYELNDLRYNIKTNIVEDLLDIVEKEDKNRLEKLFLANKGGKNVEYELREMRGKHLIAQNQLEAALEVMKSIPRDDREKYIFHPFRDKLSDCVNCTVKDTVDYDKVTLIEKILELDYKGRASLEKGGVPFYLVGLAHYNMSYYGNTWEAMDYYRSGANWSYRNDEDVYRLYESPFGNKENKDVSTAQYYFEKARLVTDNKELAARAAFMAARCEQKTWFNHRDCKYRYPNKYMPKIPSKHNTYFQMLVENYKDTKFFKKAIKECKYFRAYAYK